MHSEHVHILKGQKVLKDVTENIIEEGLSCTLEEMNQL
jgi:hypothetical protein